MQEVSNNNFGIVIAYLIPGFVALWGISLFSETVRTWLGTPSALAPTVGGFLYVTLASLALGLLVSTLRWGTIDAIHHRTGIREPDWRFEALPEKLAAFEVVIGHHYRHYQFHANLLLAAAFTFGAYWVSSGRVSTWVFAVFVLLEVVLWFGSRDTLRKYYRRGEALLGRGRTPVSEPRPLPRKLLKLDGPLR